MAVVNSIISIIFISDSILFSRIHQELRAEKHLCKQGGGTR